MRTNFLMIFIVLFLVVGCNNIKSSDVGKYIIKDARLQIGNKAKDGISNMIRKKLGSI